jgi:hypothetical protein
MSELMAVPLDLVLIWFNLLALIWSFALSYLSQIGIRIKEGY